MTVHRMHSESIAVGGQAARSGRAADIVEVVSVLALSALFIVLSQVLGASTMRGGMAAFVGVMAVLSLTLWFHRRRKDPWSELGLARPRNLLATVLLGIAATAVIMVLAGVVQQLVVTPGLSGQTPDTTRFNVLRGNLPMLALFLTSAWISAGFGEEVVFRGFLMGRLSRLLGGGRVAWVASAVLGAAVFGALHFYQGVAGMIITGFVGLLLGLLYLAVRRNLWVGILAHGLIDTISLTALYLGAQG